MAFHRFEESRVSIHRMHPLFVTHESLLIQMAIGSFEVLRLRDRPVDALNLLIMACSMLLTFLQCNYHYGRAMAKVS